MPLVVAHVAGQPARPAAYRRPRTGSRSGIFLRIPRRARGIRALCQRHERTFNLLSEADWWSTVCAQLGRDRRVRDPGIVGEQKCLAED